MKKLIATLFATIALTTPAQAGMVEARQLLDMIEKTGTKISFNTNTYDEYCADGRAGYYHYAHKVEDLFVVCSDNVNTEDPDALWEVVAHEATHVMQASTGDTVFVYELLPRMFRELDRKAPHYAKLINTSYAGEHATHEAEAFWMELQPPAQVLSYFEQACLSTDD